VSMGGGFVLALIPELQTTTERQGDDSAQETAQMGRAPGVSRWYEGDSPLRLMPTLLEHGSQSDDGRSTKISHVTAPLARLSSAERFRQLLR